MSPHESTWDSGGVAEFWKRWEGLTVDGKFLLGQYLGGAPNRAVFLTDSHVGETPRAAIKLELADGPQGEFRLSRWRLASGLSHPHLAPMLACGSSVCNGSSVVYAVTEYAGENLSQVLEERPLTTAETLEMLEPLLAALGYVHSQGFAHGHLSPANVMAVADQLKISSDSLCPVEAAEDNASPSADIRSLGVLLCEALTRQREPSEAVPQPFLDIVRLCMRTNPDERPTAAGILQRLRQPARAREARAARPRYLLWVFLLGVVTVALVLGSRLFRGHPDEAPTPPSSPAPAEMAPVEKPSPAAAPPVLDVPRTVVERALPEVPRPARDTIHGTVRINVKVRVDAAGRVTDARYDGQPGSAYLGKLTLEAARRWRFQPGSGSEDWLLRFQLLRTETKVTAARM
jgi:TonB family protein